MFKTVFFAAALISATAGIARAGEGSGDPFPFRAGPYSVTTIVDQSVPTARPTASRPAVGLMLSAPRASSEAPQTIRDPLNNSRSSRYTR